MYDNTVACVHGLPKRIKNKPMCVCCSLAKSTVKRSSRNAWNARATRPVQRLHLDLIGKFKHQSLGGAYYALVIVDDFSGLTEVYTLPDKQSMTVLDEFKTFIAQHCGGSVPESVMTDWGTEFDGHFAKYCRDERIQMRKSCPY